MARGGGLEELGAKATRTKALGRQWWSDSRQPTDQGCFSMEGRVEGMQRG